MMVEVPMEVRALLVPPSCCSKYENTLILTQSLLDQPSSANVYSTDSVKWAGQDLGQHILS